MKAGLAASALCCILAGPAAAQGGSGEVDAMYRDALRAIAEGRNTDASDTLRTVVALDPLHAGAWLDLALVQCELGRADEAERLFAAILRRFDPPPGILQLIGEARSRGCARWRPRSYTAVQIGRGVDQNVNQGTSNPLYDVGDGSEASLQSALSSDFLPRHDQYTALSVDTMRDLTPNGTLGYVQLQSRRHDRMRDYDSTALFLGAETPWRHGRWTMRASVQGGFVTLGGRGYQRLAQLQAQLGVPLPLPATWQFTTLAGVTRADYLTLADFDGTTFEWRGQLVYRDGGHYASASLGLHNDRAAGSRPGGDRHGNLATLLWRRPLPAGLTGELAYTRQQWRGSSAYAPDLIDQVRDQRTQTLRASLSYAINRSHKVVLDLRKIRNDENISLFRYISGQAQLSWQWAAP